MPIPILQKTLQSMLLGGDGGEVGGGDLKEVSFMIVLLGGGNHRMLALLWIIIFDFYMVLCPHQIIHVNNFSVVKLSFYRRTSILNNCDLSTCQINRPLRKVNI